MVRRKKVSKPSAKLVKLAKKYKVKISVKRGSKRVYKTERLLKKQIKMKMRKMKKGTRRSTRRSKSTKRTSRFRFGQLNGYLFDKDLPNYGYNQPVNQVPSARGQSSEWVGDAAMNAARPGGMNIDGKYVPTYGTYAAFFDQDVPRVLPPEWNFMGQPNGEPPVAVGSPFYRYTSEFGRRKKAKKTVKRTRRYNVDGSNCNKLRKSLCKSKPNCTYVKSRGCRRRKGTAKKGGLVYEGPSLADFGKYRFGNLSYSSLKKNNYLGQRSNPTVPKQTGGVKKLNIYNYKKPSNYGLLFGRRRKKSKYGNVDYAKIKNDTPLVNRLYPNLNK
jgi:hypothetical protein